MSSIGSNTITSPRPNEVSHRVFVSISLLFAGFYFSTGILKLSELLNSYANSFQLSAFQQLLFVAACVEFYFAYWWLSFSNIFRLIFWQTILLGVFLVFSLALLIMGSSACGCYGIVRIPLSLSILITGSLLILTVLLNKWVTFFKPSPIFKSPTIATLFAAILLGAIAPIFLIASSPSIFGSKLVLSQNRFNIAYNPSRDQFEQYKLTITNLSSNTERIIGYHFYGNSCRDAFDVLDLPVEILPFSQAVILVNFKAAKVYDVEELHNNHQGSPSQSNGYLMVKLITERVQAIPLLAKFDIDIDSSHLGK